MVTELKLHSGGKPTTDTSGELANRIRALIREYDGMPLAAAIGVLEIVKLELVDAHKDC